jgi:hypothetical protein
VKSHHIPKALEAKGRDIIGTNMENLNDAKTGIRGDSVNFHLPIKVDVDVGTDFLLYGFGHENERLKDLGQ